MSSIIKECKQNDQDFDLLRQVAFIIKNKGLDLNFLASSIRLRKISEDNSLNEEQIESFIEKIEVHCFKRSLKVHEFINLISNVSDISNNLDVTIDGLPEYVSQKKGNIERNSTKGSRFGDRERRVAGREQTKP